MTKSSNGWRKRTEQVQVNEYTLQLEEKGLLYVQEILHNHNGNKTKFQS